MPGCRECDRSYRVEEFVNLANRMPTNETLTLALSHLMGEGIRIPPSVTTRAIGSFPIFLAGTPEQQ
jgi:hypothetical protein